MWLEILKTVGAPAIISGLLLLVVNRWLRRRDKREEKRERERAEMEEKREREREERERSAYQSEILFKRTALKAFDLSAETGMAVLSGKANGHLTAAIEAYRKERELLDRSMVEESVHTGDR